MSSPSPLVAVLLGGPSPEHEVSIATGERVLASLPASRFTAAPVFIDPMARWFFPPLPYPPGKPWREGLSAATAWRPGDGPMPWRPDACFIGLHGAYGEDGVVQAILDGLGVRYTGSGAAASRLAMNKAAAKARYREAGLPVAPGIEIPVESSAEEAASRVAQELSGPWVVKPRDGGSSVGVQMIDRREELTAALARGLALGPLLIEERITGVELTCGVLDDFPGRVPRALPVTEIRPRSDFFDYRAKYIAGASEELTPAPIGDPVASDAQRLALAAHRALDCTAYSRSDFILRRGGGLVLLETNTLPGLTATSLVPQEAAAAGIPYPALLTRLLQLALGA